MEKKEIEKVQKNIVTIKNSSRTQHTKIKQCLQDIFTWLKELNEKLEQLSELVEHPQVEFIPEPLTDDFTPEQVNAELEKDPEPETKPTPEPKPVSKISEVTAKALGKGKKK